MAGLWPLSYTQQIGQDGRPSVGMRAYFFEAGTTTPLQTYTDYSLAVPNPSFIETDGFGRFGPAFLDDNESVFYRVRVTESDGTVIFDVDAQPIIGPGDGEGGDPPAPVDPDALLETGDMKLRYGTGTIQGFVRANGRTIGSAVSGASERANADTQPLYEHLWEANPNLTVSGGRGVSATADFEANKALSLPDFRGRAPIGLDDMGNSAAGVFPGLTTLGKMDGGSTTLIAAQIPEITGTAASAGAHTHGYERYSSRRTADGGSQVSQAWEDGTTVQTASAGAHTHTVTAGSSSPTSVPTRAPGVAITFYIKL